MIWQTGSNDPLRGVTIEHFREATLDAVKRIRDAGIDIVLMEPQWCPKLEATPGSDRFRNVVREIGKELNVPVIRRADLMHDWVRKACSPQAAFRGRWAAHGRWGLRPPGRGGGRVDPARRRLRPDHRTVAE